MASTDHQLLIRIRTELGDAQRELEELRRRFDQLNRQGHSTAAGMHGLRDVLASVVAAVSVDAFVDVLAEFDRLNASLKTVTGSLAGAQRASAFLREFAADTPYELAEVTEAFIRLRSLGLDTSERAMRSIGNTAAAMGTDMMQFIEAVADASTGEFERLKEFGIRAGVAVEESGDKIKFTFRGVTSVVANDARSITEYLIKIGETDFAGGMQDQMDTIGGSLSNLKDAFSNFIDFLGNLGIRDALKIGFAGATEFLKTFQQQLNGIFGSGISAQRDYYSVQLAQSRRVYNQLLDLKKVPLLGDVLAPNAELAQRERDLRNLEETLKTLNNLQKTFEVPPESSAPETGGDSPGKTKKPKSSVLDDARQEVQSRLELQRAAARLELAEQQAGLTAGQQSLQRQLDANHISYQTYYAQLAELRQADIDAQIEAKRREVAIAEAAQANLPADKGAAAIERAKAQAEIEQLVSEIGRLDAQKGDIVADLQADLAEKDQSVADQLDQFRLRLLELQNNDGVRLADIVIPPEQQTLFQARLTVLQNQYRDFIEQLKAAGNTEGVQIIERLINAEAVAQFKGRFSEMTEFGRQAAHNVQDAFANFLFEPFKGGLDGMLKGFVDTLRRMAAEAASQQILKGIFGGLKDLNLFGSGDFFGSMLASVKHSGGMAGAGGAARRIPALAFVGAPRLHSGGWIKPGEVPTILQTDEEVLTANDPRHRNNFRPGSNVEVHVHEAPGTRATVESRETEQGPRIDVLIEMVKGAVQSDIAKGGDVARIMEQRYRLNPAAGATR